jgi:hypothetical protein
MLYCVFGRRPRANPGLSLRVSKLIFHLNSLASERL